MQDLESLLKVVSKDLETVVADHMHIRQLPQANHMRKGLAPTIACPVVRILAHHKS